MPNWPLMTSESSEHLHWTETVWSFVHVFKESAFCLPGELLFVTFNKLVINQ